jgi:hypothetical protein
VCISSYQQPEQNYNIKASNKVFENAVNLGTSVRDEELLQVRLRLEKFGEYLLSLISEYFIFSSVKKLISNAYREEQKKYTF